MHPEVTGCIARLGCVVTTSVNPTHTFLRAVQKGKFLLVLFFLKEKYI